MVDGVVDIPLPGRSFEPEGEDGSAAAACHFLAGPENRLIEVAVRSIIDQPDTGYNPLVLCGPSGSGKSHIAQGLATVWRTRNRRDRVVLTTAVDFARELADAIESQAVEEFRVKHRTANLLVVEDLGQLTSGKSGKLSAQEEFIHTLDAMLVADGWVVVTASAAPAELPGLLPALQSRLAVGLTIPLAPPGPAARLAVLQQLAALRKVQLPESVAQVLADGLAGTVPDLAGALLHLAMGGPVGDGPIDLPSVRRYLTQRNRQQQPSLHEIALATARHFSLRLADLRSPVRRRALVTARGVAIYLARHFAGASLQEIGRYFGGRDHTTIMHSCRKMEEIAEGDPTLHTAIEKLRKELWKS
jgi:chromosomal replication initiator protein